MNSHELQLLSANHDARLVGKSAAFVKVIKQVDQIAATGHTVLILGPSGAGKELIAQRLHQLGSGEPQPFIDLNCGAMPAHLIEAELFGHARGAFTGAVTSRIGHFEAVGLGTLFLDEIGELPLALQPVLLRVLETRIFRPVGSNSTRPFQGRVIAATHRNLKELVSQGLFREDLYYRLAVFEIELPGLDQRSEDIPLLADYFAKRQIRALSFTPDANTLLMRQRWPGHVRQLRNLVERLSVLAETSLINSAVLQPFLEVPGQQEVLATPGDVVEVLMSLPGKDKLAATELLLIERALQLSEGNKSAAAEMLGVGRKVIERRLKMRDQETPDLQAVLKEASALITQSRFQAAIRMLQPLLKKGDGHLAMPIVRRQLFEGYRLVGICYRGIEGWLSPNARASDETALSLGTGVCEPTELAALQFGVWSSQLMALDLRRARITAQEMLIRAQTSHRPEMLDEAYVALANTLYWLGDFDQCLSTIAQSGLTVQHSHTHVGQQGLNLAGLALTLQGLSAFHLGSFVVARAAFEGLKQLAADQHSAFSDAVILQGVAWLSCLFEDFAALEYFAQELLLLSQRNGFTFYQGVGQIFQGWHMGHNNLFEVGLATIVDGYEKQMLQHGGHLFYSFQVWKRAQLSLLAGRPEESSALIHHALERINVSQERAYLCDLMLVSAQSLLASGESLEAEHALRGTLSTAFALGSVSARITAATYLASLLVDTGRASKAFDILNHAVGDLSADSAPPILTRALLLLASLRPTCVLIQHN